jgi:putative ABC transport system permease protein
MISHYLSFAYRNLVRNKIHTAINIVGLGIGLVCFVGAYLFVDYSRSFESQFQNADRIYAIYRGVRFQGADYPPFPYVSIGLKDYVDANLPEVEGIARSQAPFEGVVSLDGEESYRKIKKVDPEFFRLFDLPLVAGELEDPLGRPGFAVITLDAADALFGTRDVVGRSFSAENRDLTIAAVMADVTGPSHLGTSFLESADGSFDIMVRYDWNLDPETRAGISPSQTEFWLGQAALTHVMLPRDGSLTPAAFTARLQDLVDNNLSAEVARITYETRHVSELPMWMADQSVFGGRAGWSITSTLLLLGVMVLAMACLNFVNLATAQAAVRGREIAMRKVLGARHGQVALQYLTESLITVGLALVLAVVLLQLAIPAVNLQLHTAISNAWLENWRPWVFFGSVVAIVGLVAGFYPALILARARPVQAFRGTALRAGPASLRTLLVGTQFVLASFLIIAVLAMYHQNQTLRRAGLELAEDPHVVITADIGDAQIEVETLGAELLRRPEITGFTSTGMRPWSYGGAGLEYARSADDSAARVNLQNHFVSYDYFETMGVALLAGRELTRERPMDRWDFDQEKQEFATPAEVNTVIDRAAAEALGWSEPALAVGELIYHRLVGQGIQPARIVGVVETASFRLVDWGTPPDGTAYYINTTLAPIPIIRVSRTDVTEGLEQIDAAWDGLSPDYPIQRNFVDEDFDRAMRLFENINSLFAGLAIFAILIATMGLFSMAAYLSTRRTKEIAIRKSIGASTAQVLRLVLWDFLRPVLVANLIAWPVAFIALSAYLAMFVDRVPLTPVPFLMSFLATLAIATVAVASQVLMTVRINPARVLRVE